MALLSVENLRTHFHTRHGVVHAVDGVSFSVEPGETVGIVGESGSGKSVLCYSLLGLVPSPPGKVESGSALFANPSGAVDLLHISPTALRAIRGKRIAMIFQDPLSALNPYLTVGEQVMEPLLTHKVCSRREAEARAVAMLQSVGLSDAPGRMRAYPHHFSGGMRQRIMIAMALIAEPELLIADEPTTALDVSVQAQILDLIKALQQRRARESGRALAMILITHNLGVAAETCDRILVMYSGMIVESAGAGDLFGRPRHPYTEALLRAIPSLESSGRDLYTIPGQPPDLLREIECCPFAPRCEFAAEKCWAGRPELREIAPGRTTACVRVQGGEI